MFILNEGAQFSSFGTAILLFVIRVFCGIMSCEENHTKYKYDLCMFDTLSIVFFSFEMMLNRALNIGLWGSSKCLEQMFLIQTVHTCEWMHENVWKDITVYIKGTPQSLFSPLVEIDVTGNVHECKDYWHSSKWFAVFLSGHGKKRRWIMCDVITALVIYEYYPLFFDPDTAKT